MDAGENVQFSGFFLYGSYFITGEHRRYNVLRSIFTGIEPKQDFKPFQGQWGAWELAARLSYFLLKGQQTSESYWKWIRATIDDPEKSPNVRHSGERRSPELVENTGFRRPPEWQ